MLGYLLAIAIGLSLGLIGGGGSVLALPTLVYVVGVPAKPAIAMTLFIVGMVSLLGVIPHWRMGNVNWRTAALFAPVAMAGTYLGAQLASLPLITDSFQLLTFGTVMVVASSLMITKKPRPVGMAPLQSLEHHEPVGWSHWLAIPLEGLMVGILTGFIGVGGGFLIIPALVLMGGLPMKQAVGTSLLIIAFNSATGFWAYLSHVTLNWPLMLGFTAAAALGTLSGAYFSDRVDSRYLQKGFGYFVLAVAVFVLIRH